MLLGAALALAAAASGAPKFDPKKPDTWQLSAKLGKGSALRDEVLSEWTAEATAPGEVALTQEEAEALLDDPRAGHVYAAKTISIIAPSMVVRQRKEHQDLLALFLKPERLAAAEQFFAEHRDELERARAAHHVDPTVVVSILTWESNLGTVTGDYVAFNSFASQAFFIEEASEAALRQKGERSGLDRQKQAQRVKTVRERARRNLKVLVRTCKSRGIDPLTVKGSWAGALGYPQFMPATLQWAEDGDGDGKIDLYTFADSIASVARYLEACGFSESRPKAVWAYNHEQAYVDGVLAFADALAARLSAADVGSPHSHGFSDAGPARGASPNDGGPSPPSR